MRAPHPSHVYRETLRAGLRLCMEPRHADYLLPGESVANLPMSDLEALYALVFQANPRVHAPPRYRSTERRR